MKTKEKEIFAKEDWEKDDKDGDYSNNIKSRLFCPKCNKIIIRGKAKTDNKNYKYYECTYCGFRYY